MPGETGQLADVKKEDGVKNLQDRIIGPDYDYTRRVKTPSQMGMSPRGSWTQLGDNIKGLLGYMDLMVSGQCEFGCASTIRRPLGNKFFVDTPLQCTDKDSRQNVKRSLYINNVPDGSIPFITEISNIRVQGMQGLLPGVMSNIAQINPLQILLSFVSGPTSTCQKITMETIDSEDRRGVETAYVLNKDIELMNEDWFTIHPKPSREQLKEIEMEDEPTDETFEVMNSESSIKTPKTLKGSKIDYSKIPDDLLIKLYYTSLGLLGIYFMFKILMKNNKKK
jgi:hypothetical protein